MMSASTRNFARKYRERNSLKFIELVIVICILLGVFMTNDVLNVIHYLLSIFVQAGLIIKLVRKNGKVRYPVSGYITLLLVIFLIMVIFFLIGSKPSAIVNRIGTLISVFGIVIVGEEGTGINIKRIIVRFTKYYVFLAAIINLDAMCFMLTQKAIWEPISYLGFRYMGPFGDPNFMALYSATVLLVLWKIDGFRKGFKIFAGIVLGVNIILANALSTYFILFMTLVIHRVWKERSIFKKQLVLMLVYGICIVGYINFREEIETIGVFMLEKMYGNYTSAVIKYSSLAGRLDTQVSAIEIAIRDWIGQGPLQIVPQLGRDTHNSYIAFFFEQGIFGIVLLIIAFKPQKRNCEAVNYISMYLMLSAMLLNVHHTSIFSLCLMIQYMDPDKKNGALLPGRGYIFRSEDKL